MIVKAVVPTSKIPEPDKLLIVTPALALRILNTPLLMLNGEFVILPEPAKAKLPPMIFVGPV